MMAIHCRIDGSAEHFSPNVVGEKWPPVIAGECKLSNVPQVIEVLDELPVTFGEFHSIDSRGSG